MQTLNYFDWIIIALSTFFGIRGFVHGFFKEIFGIVGIVGGVFVASLCGSTMGMFISERIATVQNEDGRFFTGFFVIFVLFWLASFMLTWFFESISKKSGFGLVNRVFGFIFGFCKIFLIVCIFLAVLSRIALIQPILETSAKNSILFRYMKQAGQYILQIDTQKLKQNLDEVLPSNDLNKTTQILKKVKEQTSKESNRTKEVVTKKIGEAIVKEFLKGDSLEE